MTNCKTCSLPKETLATVEEMMLAGVAIADIERWLVSQGETPSRKSLENHKLKHLDLSQKKNISPNRTQDVTTLADPSLSSAELHKKTILEMARVCDRLIAMSRIPNLSTERCLGENLFRLHDALSEVSYD